MYEYTQKDLLKNPERYEYSEFKGIDFLKSYFSSRKTELNKLKITIEDKGYINYTNKINELLKNSVSDILFNEQINLENILVNLFLNKKIKKSDEIINIFIKKYEIKKRLSSQYNLKYNENNSNYKNMRNYILLSLICIEKYEQTKNLKYLNTTIKLNDMLCSKIECIDQELDLIIFERSLEKEIKFVEELCIAKGVKIL